MTRPPARESSDVEQAVRILALVCNPPADVARVDRDQLRESIAALLSSHERLTREVERLRGLIVALPDSFAPMSDAEVDLEDEACAIRKAKP